MNKKEYSLEIGGKIMTAQFTDLADQTNGSVILRYGDTIVMATAVMSKNKKDGMDFFPLSVEYEERFYAVGKILGGRYMKREGRPSEEAILSGRIVDRTIRPLFDQYIRNEIQVIITVLSIGDEDPDVLATNAASIAIATSDIPWNGPVSTIIIGKIKGSDEFVINPTYSLLEKENFEMEMVASGKNGNINMIEVKSREVSNEIVAEALKKASVEIEKIQEFQKMLVKELGKAKQNIEAPIIPTELKELFEKNISPKLEAVVFGGNGLPVQAGQGRINELRDEWTKLYKETHPENDQSVALNYYEETVNEIIHKEAVENDRRPDGRKMDEIRPLSAQAGGISPILHGSGIFYRGGTHVLSVLTLGGPQDSLIIEGMEVQEKKRYMHHYNFPPFSSGETGRMGGTNRRMIGHGALAEKALLAVLPSVEEFPYTIRIVSECMASNGSTSMASVCGSTLSLMDGGVPIKAPVAGIASGLMMRDENNYKLLTDIQGPEDHHGDMDFKVAGTRSGITAIQMDVKVDGIPLKILGEALEKAEKARLQILDVIENEIKTPRADISQNAPRILIVKIRPDQIGGVIGTGGKIINGIKDQTGAEIDIEDDGSVYITGKVENATKAKEMIEALVKEYKPGERYEGEVTKIAEFGAFVKIGHNTEGLVHISEIAPFRIDKVTDVLKVGQIVPVVVKEIDDQKRIKLSIKLANPDFIKKPKTE